jgi:AraC-like DNA-binding protein
VGQREGNNDLPLHRFLAEPAGSVPVEIATLDCLRQNALADYPHRHDFHEICLVTDGSGEHVIDFNAYQVAPPQLFLVSPGQVHYWRHGETVTGRMILFRRDFLVLDPGDRGQLNRVSMMPSFERSPCLQLAPADADVISRLYDELILEYQVRRPRWLSVIRSYLHILLVVLRRLGDPEEAPGSHASLLVSRFKQLVSEHSTSERSVQGYARRLRVSRGHLSNTVKELTGQTPRQIIQQQLVLEAKRLLAHSDLTAAEIAYRLGFDDPSYFGRFFRRETSASPGHFRRTCRSTLAH